jgi:hypothetical protein
VDHPVLKDVPTELHKEQISYYPAESADSGWSFVSEPKAIGFRQMGKGKIILVQSNLRNSIWDPDVERLFSSIVSFARNGSDKPLLLLDVSNVAANWSIFDSLNIPYKRIGELDRN